MPAPGDGACDRDPTPLPRRLARIGLRVAIGSVAIGLVTSLLQPTWTAVLENVVYAECIGLAIFGLYAAPRLVERRGAAPWPLRRHLLQGMLSIPLGFVVGINVAGLAFGHRVGWRAFTNVAPVAVVVTIVSTLGFVYYFWSSRRLAEEAAARADALRTAAEARLKLLQTQIEPHMLFNTLANLRTLVDVDPARAQTMIDELIVYLRATLGASRSATTSLVAEFEQLRAYLELMKVRMAHRLGYTLELADDVRDAAIPPMLLQPLVENAIRHGLEPKIDGGTIRIVAARAAGRLSIAVTDDGVGLDDGFVPGYGLAHVRERLATLYGDRAEVSMTRADAGGVAVRIVMPLAAPPAAAGDAR